MLHYMTGCASPLKYASCGRFVSDIAWRHPERTLNTFVLLIGREGVLYIEQNGRRYEMRKGDAVLLIPGQPHVGFRMCEPGLSYDWCHFFSREKEIRLLEAEEMRRQVMAMHGIGASGGHADVLLLPEFGRIDTEERVAILFRQLLDYANGGCYSSYFMDYTLTLLGMEISRQCVEQILHGLQPRTHSEQRLHEIIEWIRIHRDQRLNVREVAERFHYNPEYLSSLFRQATGDSLLRHIHRVKMADARERLLQTQEAIREVAARTGYEDEKHFMKVFRQYEGMTPTQYRNAFVKTHMNRG